MMHADPIPFVPFVLALALSTSVPLTSQEPGEPGGKSSDVVVEQNSKDGELIREKEEGVNAEPFDITAPRGGLERFAGIVIGQKPWRVAPGAAGELHVVLSLRGEHVVEAGAHADLRFVAEQGPVTISSNWTVRPPRKGKLYPRYEGTPVHENTMTLVVPFTVAPDAAHGRYPVAVTPEIDISNALAGRPMGRFFGPGRGEVIVGPALPTIQRSGDAPAPSRAGDAADSPADDGSVGRDPVAGTNTADRADPAASATLLDGTSSPGGGSAGGAEEGIEALPEPLGGGSSQALLIGLIGLVLLVVVVVVIRR